jgi:transcriptional regulator with XRE-family HTH domain
MTPRRQSSRSQSSFTPEDYRRLDSRIQEQRQARGWKQRELSQRAEILPDRLSRIERGAEPRIAEIVGLSRAFGMGIEELLFGAAHHGDELDLLVHELRAAIPAADQPALFRLLRALVAGFRLDGRP